MNRFRAARRGIFARSRGLRASAGLALAALWLGCAAIEHSMQASEFSGRPLSPREGRGAVRYRAELEHDATLKSHVAEHGTPDYFYLVSRDKLYFFYLQSDRAFMFERVVLGPSTATELGRIPGSLVKLLPQKTQRQIVARRRHAQRQAQTAAKRSKSRIARSPTRTAPAAQAPAGTYIGGFEVDAIVARMREPLTAADPGVKSWRRAQTSAGIAYTTSLGAARYEVSHGRVAFTVKLSASRKTLPPSARLAIRRLNSAIFAAKAEAVTQQVTQLAEQAAHDRTGRTAFHKRIAGRTVRIGRYVDRGVFVYSVQP